MSDFYQRLFDAHEAIRPCFSDESVTDICVNPDGGLWIKRDNTFTHHGVIGALKRETIVMEAAARNCQELSEIRCPSLDINLPNGERMVVAGPPVTSGYWFSIRLPLRRRASLDDFREQGILSDTQIDGLLESIAHRSIVICGHKGTRKTTLAKALLSDERCRHYRMVSVETVREIELSPNSVSLVSTGDDRAPMDKLIGHMKRTAQDVTIIGEIITSDEAWRLINLVIAGEKGVSTMHVASPEKAPRRLRMMTSRHGHIDPDDIADACEVICHLKQEEGRLRGTVFKCVAINDRFKLTGI